MNGQVNAVKRVETEEQRAEREIAKWRAMNRRPQPLELENAKREARKWDAIWSGHAR